MKKMITLLFGIILIAGCKKEDLPNGTPECIADKIEAILNEPVWNPPAKVYSYTFDGEKVYFFPQRCCDFPSDLFDEDCNFICSPDGGITGAGDGNCPDFFTQRTDEMLIWEDAR